MSYEEQLSAARFRAERDLARQELDRLRKEIEAMRPRLMPEGMEWPRYDTGEMVMIGDQIDTPNGGGELCGVEFSSCGMCTLSTEGANGEGQITIDLDNGERVKRLAVLAADRKPLREVETVWGINGATYRVTGVRDGEVFARYVGGSFGAEVESAGGEGLYRLRADHVTHERPVADTWERIEEDARKLAFDYWRCSDVGCDDCPAKVDGERPSERFCADSCGCAQQIDLVRRAKELAERGE